MLLWGITMAAVLAAPAGAEGAPQAREDSRLIRPPFPVAIDVSAQPDTPPPSADPDRSRHDGTEAEAARRKAAKQPKDLRNPFLLAQHQRPPTDRMPRPGHDLRPPFDRERSSGRGPDVEPRDLRHPFERAPALAPVDSPTAPNARCASQPTLRGGVVLQRPQALQRELCGMSVAPEHTSAAHIAHLEQVLPLARPSTGA